MKLKIDVEEYISFGADFTDIVFKRKGMIYRGIKKGCEDIIFHKFECGLIPELLKKKLIPNVKITNYFSDDFDLILEVEKLNIIEPKYWTFSMVKDAAIHILYVNQIANKYKYQLIDAHLFNVTFRSCRPIFFDIGSFVPYTKEIAEGFLAEFKRTLAVLLLMNIRDIYFARKLLTEPETLYVRTEPQQFIENTPTFLNALSVFKKYHRENSSKEFNLLLDELFEKNTFEPEYVDKIFQRPLADTAWGLYQHKFLKNDNLKSIKYINKYDRFKKIIKIFDGMNIHAKTCLDIAGNSGVFSYMFSEKHQNISLFSLDYDENAVEFCYNFIRKESKNIDFYFCNFVTSKSLKIKADVVFILACTHHLLLVQKINIDMMFSIIKKHTTHYIFCEFMPLGIWDGKNKGIPIPEWYKEDFFEEKFKKYFDLISKHILEKNRVLFVGKIK